MSLDTAAGTTAPAALALQYLNIKLIPIVGGKLSIAMEATLLDEAELQFVGEDLAHARVDTLDEAIAIIRKNAAILQAA